MLYQAAVATVKILLKGHVIYTLFYTDLHRQ